jgi:hypothetical protein
MLKLQLLLKVYDNQLDELRNKEQSSSLGFLVFSHLLVLVMMIKMFQGPNKQVIILV